MKKYRYGYVCTLVLVQYSIQQQTKQNHPLIKFPLMTDYLQGLPWHSSCRFMRECCYLNSSSFFFSMQDRGFHVLLTHNTDDGMTGSCVGWQDGMWVHVWAYVEFGRLLTHFGTCLWNKSGSFVHEFPMIFVMKLRTCMWYQCNVSKPLC